MIFTLIRDPVIRISGSESFTPGQLYASGLRVGYTCEDEDRNLENGKEAKIYGRTAIPRGTYPLEVSYSHRFGKLLPAVLDVPGYAGIRIHGGNRAEDSLGCILVGQVRTGTGIAQCAGTVQRVIAMITACEERNEKVVLVIK